MKNVLITGANSFIGRRFKAFASDFFVDEVDLIERDVSTINFSEFDVVFHVAAIVHQDVGVSDDLYYKVNRDLAVQVATEAKRAGVRQFVFMSTVKVYGENNTEDTAWNEASPCQPQDAYGKSKYEAEQLLQGLNDATFAVSIVRTPVVYGQGVKGNILRMAGFVKKYPLIPFGNIDNVRAMVYVGNLLAMIQTIIAHERSGVFLASDSEVLSTSAFVKVLVSASRRRRLVVGIPGFAQAVLKAMAPLLYRRIFGSLVIDNRLTMETLDFHPPYSVQHGFTELMDSL